MQEFNNKEKCEKKWKEEENNVKLEKQTNKHRKI